MGAEEVTGPALYIKASKHLAKMQIEHMLRRSRHMILRTTWIQPPPPPCVVSIALFELTTVSIARLQECGGHEYLPIEQLGRVQVEDLFAIEVEDEAAELGRAVLLHRYGAHAGRRDAPGLEILSDSAHVTVVPCRSHALTV